MTTPIQKTLLALAAGLLAASAPLAAAQAAVQNRPTAQQHQNDRQNDRNDSRDNRQNGNGGDSRYGRWDNSWGARPAAPPRHFTRSNDWYRHVRACQQRYRSYNAATDRYTVRRGQTAVCRL